MNILENGLIQFFYSSYSNYIIAYWELQLGWK